MVARAVNGPCGGQQRHPSALRIEQNGLAGGIRFWIVEAEQLAGGGHEHRQAAQVGPGLNGLQIQNSFVGPTAFSSVTDVVHDERALVYATGNFRSGVLVTLSTRGVGLDVGVGVDFHHVVLVVVGPQGVAVFLAVLHVAVTVLVVAVLVVGHKQHPVAPRAVGAAAVGVQTRGGVHHFLVHPHVGRHFADHGHRRVQIHRRNAAHSELQQILGPLPLAFSNQCEIVVRDVARGGLKRLQRVVTDHRVSIALHVPVFVGCISHQQEVARCGDAALALRGPIRQHHHQHFDGGGIGHP